jgi:VCBS repeat protein
VLVADFDNDGWPEIYVANDSQASLLYHNQKNGKFADIGVEAGCAFSPDGKPQAGMGVSAGDYDGDGNLDIVKTNFAGDTHSLYRNGGNNQFEDVTYSGTAGRVQQRKADQVTANRCFQGYACEQRNQIRRALIRTSAATSSKRKRMVFTCAVAHSVPASANRRNVCTST